MEQGRAGKDAEEREEGTPPYLLLLLLMLMLMLMLLLGSMATGDCGYSSAADSVSQHTGIRSPARGRRRRRRHGRRWKKKRYKMVNTSKKLIFSFLVSCSPNYSFNQAQRIAVFQSCSQNCCFNLCCVSCLSVPISSPSNSIHFA
jgi:hypothetical protein